jgi:tRNA (cmo5U34)-methyltransferase
MNRQRTHPDAAPQAAPSIRDEVFKPALSPADFAFNSVVARAFDDMVGRSVPFYAEIQRMVCEMAGDFAEPGTCLYDLGCSTATTLTELDRVVKPGVTLIGVDNSADMLAKAREKLDAAPLRHDYRLICADLHEGPVLDNASVVVLVLTLQFVRPLYREKLLQRIWQGLNPGGALLLVEKLTCKDTTLNRLFIKYYYDMKRRHGYSENEIAQKREALENVLIPYRPEENRKLLADCGFRSVEEAFRWYNFCTMVAIK